MEHKSYWIWYPGDLSIYHAMKQNLSREERGFSRPAFWQLSDCRKNVRFHHSYELLVQTSFLVHSNASGYVGVNGKKYPLEKKILCGPGHQVIEVCIGEMSGVPSIYIDGDVIKTDATWTVDDYLENPVLVGTSQFFTRPEQNPSDWEYEEVLSEPVRIMSVGTGTLYEFASEIYGTVRLHGNRSAKPVVLCYGESKMEALDVNRCYLQQTLSSMMDPIPKRAFRYLFLPNQNQDEITVSAVKSYVNIPVRANFYCDDEELNEIFAVSGQTFQLCSGIFFIDGIKRDRWIWSGDAYQSYCINPYYFFDEEINRRTILALRGQDPVRQHINTIVDYSLFWILSIKIHYEMTGDLAFIRMLYPKVKSMMDFLETQVDEYGFLIGRKGDWIFIDWAEIDKDGAACGEQILFAQCYEWMVTLLKLCPQIDTELQTDYQQKYTRLRKNIQRFFWCEKKHAFVDSFHSGKEHVSRQTNLLAILFQSVDDSLKNQIKKNVIENSNIPSITTPYFQFYELEALCRLGEFAQVKRRIKEYWGGMLQRGAVTFWEQFDPQKGEKEQYSMYSDPYGKSLCHAWGASQIYLIGRYFLGIRPLTPGYQSFAVEPRTELFKQLKCTFPIKEGEVQIRFNQGILSVKTNRDGGILYYHGEHFLIEKDCWITITCNGKETSSIK